MLQMLTISEFCTLKVNDEIIINIGNRSERVTVIDHPFYNTDSNEPGWEVETDAGFVAFRSAYRDVPLPNINNCRLITLEEFRRLTNGNVINDGSYVAPETELNYNINFSKHTWINYKKKKIIYKIKNMVSLIKSYVQILIRKY